MKHLKIIAEKLGFFLDKKGNIYLLTDYSNRKIFRKDCLYAVAKFLAKHIEK